VSAKFFKLDIAYNVELSVTLDFLTKIIMCIMNFFVHQALSKKKGDSKDKKKDEDESMVVD